MGSPNTASVLEVSKKALEQSAVDQTAKVENLPSFVECHSMNHNFNGYVYFKLPNRQPDKLYGVVKDFTLLTT